LVNDAGQLYTIEGVAAAILLLVTVYIVLGTTTVFTPGDSHISDLQLVQLGDDALAMMDTPTQYVETYNISTEKQSVLENDIMNPTAANLTNFYSNLTNYLNVKSVSRDHLNYNAIVWYRNSTSNSTGNYQFNSSSFNMTGREHYVRVTRLVYLSGLPNQSPPNPSPTITSLNPAMDNRPQTVLLDVTIWRD